MIQAKYADRSLVVSILLQSFDHNKSVNYVAKQDSRRKERIKVLMTYSFEICYLYGKVYLSEDKKACALLLYKEKISYKSLYWDLILAFRCIGIFRIGNILRRQAQIKEQHPKTPFTHLWFLGVNPAYQHQGIGTKLLAEIIARSNKERKDIYLETSTITNVPWYEKSGFKIIKELNVGYLLTVMKRKYCEGAV